MEPADASSKPLIVLSNDDGIDAPGISALHRELMNFADVVVVAPKTEQSSKSHSMTLSAPLRHETRRPGVHVIDGTPADCVYFAFHREGLLPRAPDLVVSGINHGYNLGNDVFYSGTVAAAREGALRGVSAIACSMHHQADPAAAASVAGRVIRSLLGALADATQTVLVNLNIPAGSVHGVRSARLGRRIYEDLVTVRHDPWGREYLWLGGPAKAHVDEAPDTDIAAVFAGYAAVTSLQLDLTASDEVARTLATVE